MSRRLRSYTLLVLLGYAAIHLIRQYAPIFPSSHLPLKKIVDATLDDEISKFLRAVGSSVTQNTSRESSKKKILQSALICSTKKGTWKFGSDSGQTWPFFAPHAHCPGAYSSVRSTSRTASLDICDDLAGKKVLFVGPETTFYLHSLWLTSLETYENRSLTCLGRDFCTFHHICRRPAVQGEILTEELIGRKKKMPSQNMLLATNSSLLQYSLSSTLHVSKNQYDKAYVEPVVDLRSGIRTANTYWLRRARKADILVINRGPIPAPSMTYAFADAVTDRWAFTTNICAKSNYFGMDQCKKNLESRLVNAALHATVDLFLPAVLESLGAINQDPDIAKSSHLMWHSSWYIQPSCAIAGLPPSVPLLQEIWSDNNASMVDPWSFYYNSQVYMHDRLLPQILPHFNFTYIPLTMPPYVKRLSARFRFPEEHEVVSMSQAKDCLRHPWPTFGVDTLEEVFFGALEKSLHFL